MVSTGHKAMTSVSSTPTMSEAATQAELWESTQGWALLLCQWEVTQAEKLLCLLTTRQEERSSLRSVRECEADWHCTLPSLRQA